MEFRVGSTGVGAFAGCGVGLGIISPIRLEGIPVIGQVVASVRSAFFQLDSSMLGGNLQRSTRHISSSVSSKLGTGMSAGAGCGILLGYGYGAGLYLKPDVTHDLMRRITDTRKRFHAMLVHHHPQLFKSLDTAHSSAVDRTSISTAVNSNVNSSSSITPAIDQTTHSVPDVSLKELKLQVSELNKAMVKQRNKVDSLEAELKEMKEELWERWRSL
jgi:uncharacterized coiled-coil protein SlyX